MLKGVLRRILIILLFIVHSTAYCMDEGAPLSASNIREWLKLLHDNQIQDPRFYLSKEGMSSALVELTSSIDQLKKNPQYTCLFPARAHFLSQKLGMASQPCPAVEEWKKTMQASSVAMVYVTQYVSNPASAFGHTFILFKNEKKPLHLNLSISNAATMPENVSGVDYIFKGITGGFPAEFSIDLFYLKAQEYNNIENRDMWIYDLNLTSEQTDQLLNHIWELSNQTSQGYLFLNRNCSVNSYNALAAIHPELEFLPTSAVFILPVETMAKLYPVTHNIEYSPSLREKMALRSQLLTPPETQEFQNTISDSSTFIPSNNIEVAELTLENFELLRSRQYGKLSAEQNSAYQSALIHRAELGQSPSALKYSRPLEPHNALPPSRMALSGGARDEDSYYSFSVSPFYHALLENPAGYRPFSEFILLDAEIQTFAERSQLSLNLLQLTNFPTVTAFDSQWSYRLRAGFEAIRDCKNCWSFSGEASFGKSWKIHSKVLLFGLLGAYQNVDTPVGPQATVGGLSDFSSTRMLYQIRALRSENSSEWTSAVDLGINLDLFKNTSLELVGSYKETVLSSQLSLAHHF